ncbi:hypothetical protein Bca4012_089745 [Brassica carinata]
MNNLKRSTAISKRQSGQAVQLYGEMFTVVGPAEFLATPTMLPPIQKVLPHQGARVEHAIIMCNLISLVE